MRLRTSDTSRSVVMPETVRRRLSHDQRVARHSRRGWFRCGLRGPGHRKAAPKTRREARSVGAEGDGGAGSRTQPTTSSSVLIAVCLGRAESLTRTETAYVPATFGVPESTFAPPLIRRPFGSVVCGALLHRYG